MPSAGKSAYYYDVIRNRNEGSAFSLQRSRYPVTTLSRVFLRPVRDDASRERGKGERKEGCEKFMFRGY